MGTILILKSDIPTDLNLKGKQKRALSNIFPKTSLKYEKIFRYVEVLLSNIQKAYVILNMSGEPSKKNLRGKNAWNFLKFLYSKYRYFYTFPFIHFIKVMKNIKIFVFFSMFWIWVDIGDCEINYLLTNRNKNKEK